MCFDSNSSSSSSQSTSQTDNRIGATDNAIVASHGSISVLDGGAIQAAKDLGIEALAGHETIALAAIENARVLGSGALSAIAENADKAFEFVDKQRMDGEARAFQSAIPWLIGGASVIAITLAIRSK